jgi:hypothetical protein
MKLSGHLIGFKRQRPGPVVGHTSPVFWQSLYAARSREEKARPK